MLVFSLLLCPNHILSIFYILNLNVSCCFHRILMLTFWITAIMQYLYYHSGREAYSNAQTFTFIYKAVCLSHRAIIYFVFQFKFSQCFFSSPKMEKKHAFFMVNFFFCSVKVFVLQEIFNINIFKQIWTWNWFHSFILEYLKYFYIAISLLYSFFGEHFTSFFEVWSNLQHLIRPPSTQGEHLKPSNK